MSSDETNPNAPLPSQCQLILIVDDTPANLAVVGEHLTGQGYQVMVARDGETGLRLSQQHQPDLILLDVILPDIDGFEVCRRLKADEKTHEIPVIFMTIVAGTEDKVIGFTVGGVDYVTKPFQYEELLARVTTHLRIRTLTRELQAARELLEQRIAERTTELAQANTNLRLEITERQRAEDLLVLNAEHMNVLLRLNQMTSATAAEIMDFAFEKAVHLTKSKIGYLAFLNMDETVLTMKLWSRTALVECNMDDKPIEYPLEIIGLWGEAVRQRRPIITNDYNAPNPWKKGYPNGHVQLTRHMNVPVIVDSRIVLVAGVGNKEDDYDETDVQQLTLLTEGMWRLLERKHAEEELKRHRDHLEVMVKERTIELMVAKERAEAANRAKSTFLANMSHELRTPLNAILGYAQILQQRLLDAKDVEGVTRIHESGQHLLALITDLLELSKLEVGKIELHPSPFQLSTFLNSLLSTIRARAEAKGIAFVVEASNDLPLSVVADATCLRQVLLHLLSNAVKFTISGQITFRISSVKHLSPDNSQPEGSDAGALDKVLLRFEVTDTGIGIAPEQLEHIFQPFERPGNLAPRAERPGLSLLISRQRVQMMGGDLHVQSEMGRGSTFWFEISLPIMQTESEALVPLERAIVGYHGPRRRLLVVDNSSPSRAALADILQPLGFELVEAQDEQQAIQMAMEMRPDLILIDCWASITNDLNIVSQLQQIPDLKNIPLIGISANASEIAQTVNDAGGYASFLLKPVHETELLALLEEHLKLVWKYSEKESLTTLSASVDIQDDKNIELVPPSKDELAILLNLAMKGDMLGIEACAARLAAADPNLQPFANRLRHLAKAFEDDQILALVKNM